MAKTKIAQVERITEVSDFLLKTGLLFEINRKVLHPLGLALEVSVDGEDATVSAIWDCRKDPEGVLFDDKTFKFGSKKLESYMKKRGTKALRSRQDKLGFIEQTGV